MSKKPFKKKPELVTLPKEDWAFCQSRIAGAILLDGADRLDYCKYLSEDDFPDEDCKSVFKSAKQFKDAGQPADGAVIMATAGLHGDRIDELVKNAIGLDGIEYYAQRVKSFSVCDKIRKDVMPLLHAGDAIGAQSRIEELLNGFTTSTATTLSASDWLSLQDEETCEVVLGLIDLLGRVAVVAQSKMRKSSYVLQLAFSIATGISFLGYEVKPMRTLIINGEISSANYKKRLRKMIKSLGVAEANLNNLLIANTSEDTSAWNIDRILALAKSLKVAVVIVDPFYLLIDDETDQTQVKDCVRKMKKFAQAGITLISVYHATKGKIGDKQVIDRISGSGIFARDCSTLISLCEHASEPDHAVMTCELRNHPPQPPKTIVFKDDAFHVADEVAPVEKTSTTKTARKFDHEAVAKSINRRMTYKDALEAVKVSQGVGRNTAVGLIGKLVIDGLVQTETVGRCTFYERKDMV